MLKQFFEANDEMLDLYTNAITKAHGKNHPEVFEVRKLYETIVCVKFLSESFSKS